MVRWAPLTEFLRAEGRDRIELTYDQVEEILGGSLPRSAVEHRSDVVAFVRLGCLYAAG